MQRLRNCVVTIPSLSDNFSYLIMDKTHQVAAIVDPIEPEKCLQAAQDNQVKITTILTTHSHWDHAGGNNKMKEMLLQQKHVDKVPVYGGIGDGVQGCTHEVDDMDTISLGDLKVVLACSFICVTCKIDRSAFYALSYCRSCFVSLSG